MAKRIVGELISIFYDRSRRPRQAFGNSRRALRNFLGSAYTIAELKVLCYDTHPRAVDLIDWNCAANTVTFEFVATLDRLGQIGPRFFDVLAAERPSRRQEIYALRCWCLKD
ncbi:MAG: hypothetical protein AAF449_07780 [Myxococcota bacterium]